MIAITPSAFTFVNASDMDTKQSIQFIASLNISQPVQLLEGEGGISYYLSDNFNRVVHYQKNENFEAFRVRHNVNMILVSKRLQDDSRYRSDQEWQDFLTTYSEHGYVMQEIPDTDRKVLIDETLLQQ